MLWGDFESFLQLIAALNIAFHSFKEIRSPSMSHMRRLLSETRQSIDTGFRNIDVVRKASLLPKATVTRIEDDGDIANKLIFCLFDVGKLEDAFTAAESFEWKRMEQRFSRAALAAAVVSIVLLFIASLEAHEPLKGALALFMALVGMAPVAGLLWLNLDLMRRSKAIFDNGFYPLSMRVMTELLRIDPGRVGVARTMI